MGDNYLQLWLYLFEYRYCPLILQYLISLMIMMREVIYAVVFVEELKRYIYLLIGLGKLSIIESYINIHYITNTWNLLLNCEITLINSDYSVVLIILWKIICFHNILYFLAQIKQIFQQTDHGHSFSPRRRFEGFIFWRRLCLEFYSRF